MKSQRAQGTRLEFKIILGKLKRQLVRNKIKSSGNKSRLAHVSENHITAKMGKTGQTQP
jgi:hypothetical protein